MYNEPSSIVPDSRVGPQFDGHTPAGAVTLTNPPGPKEALRTPPATPHDVAPPVFSVVNPLMVKCVSVVSSLTSLRYAIYVPIAGGIHAKL